ncbi:hypothetical protein BCR36DRAFT_409175 [Piromyces finnis]|uniref:GAR domain-containing protein n=1 Tax=Piromyces finnis TaxID=1754191 RepID=A0A1Y1VJ05_9FUNG|nr:hypothetical protein BCR36DRAFT_409175 [Piromyces finnis]|eukprot:ORX57701.1 hypothetical protein BCR36DRAFT_409175 [Piromyces finnis]
MTEEVKINNSKNINKDVQKKSEIIDKKLNNLIEFYYNKVKENIYYENQGFDSGNINSMEECIKEFYNSFIDEKYKKDENTLSFINLKNNEYHSDIIFLKEIIDGWKFMSRKIYDINEKIQDLKKKCNENIGFNSYEEFKIFIIKVIETILFSNDELEDIKKQLIFEDNGNKSLKYFTNKFSNNKKLKELKYLLESKYLRLNENLINEIYIIEKDIPDRINLFRKHLKENEWNNDLKESFRYTIQNEEKLQKQLNFEVKLDNLQEIEKDYKLIANKCKYIDILIKADNEGIYKKRFSTDIDLMNTILNNIKEKINNLKDISNEFKLYKESYMEHIDLIKSKNNKLKDLFKYSLNYIEDTIGSTEHLKNVNKNINNFQKEMYLKYNLYYQEYQQDVVLLNQWCEYYRDINQNFDKENLKLEYNNIIEWKNVIENYKKEYENNIKKLEYINTYLLKISNLIKQKIKNNDYISIYITQLKCCEEFIKILNSDGITSTFILTNIVKCDKKIDKLFSTIERKYNDIKNEASNMYEQFIQFSNNENIKFLEFSSENYKIKVKKIFLNEEINTLKKLLTVRKLQFESIFEKLKFYNTQVDKKSNDIKNKFNYMFTNENKVFIKTIDESMKIDKEKEEYQIYHQEINEKYNELKKNLDEINKKVKSELDEKWKNCCTDNCMLISELKTIPKEIKHWCYLNIPTSKDLEEMELCMKIENEFNNFINIFIEKWNILVEYKEKVDNYKNNNKWEKLNENEINELKDNCLKITNTEIKFKRLSEILTASYACISDKNTSAIIDVQDTMIEKFETFKKNILIINNKCIKVSSANIKNETTENFLKNNQDWCYKKLNEINDYKYSIRAIDLNPIYEMYNCNFENNFSKCEDYEVSLSCLVKYFMRNDNLILKNQNISFNENYEIISEKKLEFEKFFSTLLINDFCIEKRQTIIEKYNKLKEDLQEWKIIISDFEMACDCKEYMLNILFFINLTDKKLDMLHDLLENSFNNYASFHSAELKIINIKNKISQFNFEIKRNTIEHSKLINFKNKEYIYRDLNLLYKNISEKYNNLKMYLNKIEGNYKKASYYYEGGKRIINILKGVKERRKLILNDESLLCFNDSMSKDNQIQCKNDIDECLLIYNEMINNESEKSFLNNHGISKYMKIVKKEINDIDIYIKNSITKENALRLIYECNLISDYIEKNIQKLDKEYEQGYIFEIYTDEIEDIYSNICKITDDNYDNIEKYSKNKYRIKDILSKNNNLLKCSNVEKAFEEISKKDISYKDYKDNYNEKILKLKDHINELRNGKEKLVRINKKINEIYNILSRIEEDPKCAIEQHNGKLYLIKSIDENCQILKKIFQSEIYKKYENSMYFHHYPTDLLEKFSKIKKLIIYSQMNNKDEDNKCNNINNLSMNMEKHKEEIDIIIETTVEEYKEILERYNASESIYEKFSEVNDIFKNVIKQLQLEWIDLKDDYIDYISKENIKETKNNIDNNYLSNTSHCEYLCIKIEKSYQEIGSIFNFINNYKEILNEIISLKKTKENLIEEFRTCIPIYNSLENLIGNNECTYSDIKECSKNNFKIWRENIQCYKKKSTKLIKTLQCNIEEQTKFDEFIDTIREKIQIDIIINNYDKRLNQISELFDNINKYYDKYQICINSLIYILEHHISKENIINLKLFTINDRINYDVLQGIIDDHSLYESQYNKICNNHERKNNKYLKKIISSIMNKKEILDCDDQMNEIPLYIKEKLLDYFNLNNNIWSLKYLNNLWEIENDIYNVILNYKQLFKNLENVKENIFSNSLSFSQFEKNYNEKLSQYQINIAKIKEKYEGIKDTPSKEILRLIEVLDEKSQDMIHESELKIKKIIEDTNLINASMYKLSDDINDWCNKAKENLNSITNNFFLHIIKIPINELATIKYSKNNNDYNIVKDFINICEEDIVKYSIKEIKSKKYEVDEIDFILNHKKMLINNKINKYNGNIEFQKSINQLNDNLNDIENIETQVLSFNNRYFFTLKMLKTYRVAINLLFSIQYSEHILKFCYNTIYNDVESIDNNKLKEKMNLIRNGIFNDEFNNKMDELKNIINELNETQEEQDNLPNCDFYNQIKNLKNIQKELNNNVKSIQRGLSYNGESNENKQLYLLKFRDINLFLNNYYNEVKNKLEETEIIVNKCVNGYADYNNNVKELIKNFDQMLIDIQNEELEYNVNIEEINYIKKIKNKVENIKKFYNSEYITNIFINLKSYKHICKNYKSVDNLIQNISRKLVEYYEFINLSENFIKYFINNSFISKNLRDIQKNNINNKNQIEYLKNYLNINIFKNPKKEKEEEIKENIINKIENTFTINDTLLETSEHNIKNLIQSQNKFIKNYQKIINENFKNISIEIEKDKNAWKRINRELKIISLINIEGINKIQNNLTKIDNNVTSGINDILYNIQVIVDKINDKHVLNDLLSCYEQCYKELNCINEEMEKCSSEIDEHINFLNDIQSESDLIQSISNVLFNKLNNYKEILKDLYNKKNNLKEYVDIVFNSTEWINNFNTLEERKENLNNDIIHCSNLINNISGEDNNNSFSELYINKIINYINDSLNNWLDEIQNIERLCTCKTKFPLYKIKKISIKSSDELDKLFIEKIFVDSLKTKYEKRKHQYNNLKKILLSISLKSNNDISNEINILEKRLNKESYESWLFYYNEYLRNIKSNEEYSINLINEHNKSKEIHDYVTEYKTFLENLKKLKYENIKENDKLEKIPDEIYSIINKNLENEVYVNLIENYEKKWNIENDYINLIKYNEISYEKLYKLYNEINNCILKYNKENSIKMSMIDHCNSKLETFENDRIKLEQEIIFRHNQYNKVNKLESENNQSVNELNKYILENNQKYLSEIDNLLKIFNQTIEDITKRYEERCKDIVNEFISIQTWIQSLQNNIKQYASNLPPKPLFNILGNIISIENNDNLENFNNDINKILNSTIEESNAIIEENINHYNEINELLNEKLANYNDIFVEYSNEEKISSMKTTVNKSFDVLKEFLNNFNDYCIASRKLVDVEKKTISLYGKFTYVLYSIKTINNKLKKSEISNNTISDYKIKIKEIEKKYLDKVLKSDFNDCENIINIYNENYYDKSNKKEFVKLLVSKISKSLKDIQIDTYGKYNKLLEKIKYCSTFLSEYYTNYDIIININESVSKLNEFSCDNNISTLEIEDYKKVFNEILNNIEIEKINKCELYIQSLDLNQNQNIYGVKCLIDKFKKEIQFIKNNLSNSNIEHNLINEIYKNNKELKEIRNIILLIQEKFREFKNINDNNTKIEMKVIFEKDIKKLEKSFDKVNRIFDIKERYQETLKNIQKYMKLFENIKIKEDDVHNEIKKLRNQWKEILNYINKLEEEEKLKKILEELHKNTKEDEKKYIKELGYLNEVSPDKISTIELNNEIQKLNKIFDWIESKLFDENFKDYKWEGDPDSLKKLVQNILDKLNSVSSINKSISNTQYIKEECSKKLENFKFNIDNNKKKIATIINNIIQNGLLQQHNLEKLRLNIHNHSQDLRKINKEIQISDRKVKNVISKNNELADKYKEKYSSFINTLSIDSLSLKEINDKYEELIINNNKFIEKINEGLNWYRTLIKININYNTLKEKLISCIEIEDILNKYESSNKFKIDLNVLFSSINYKINSWKKDKLEIENLYEENMTIPFNYVNEFLEINNGLIDIKIFKMNESFSKLNEYITKRDIQFNDINKKLREIIDNNNEDIKNLLNEFKNILNKENILKYSQSISNFNENSINLENNYKVYEVKYIEVNKNINCLMEITSLASETFTLNENNDNINNLPINIYQLLMSLFNNPKKIWDYKELDQYNSIIKKSIEIVSIYKSKYNDINNIINSVNLINTKKDESNVPLKSIELKLYKAQIQEYENSYNKELEKYNNINNKYKNENDEHIQYLISCIKKEFLYFIGKSNDLLKNINNTFENEFKNIESIKRDETEIDEIKKWIIDKTQSIKDMEDNLPPSESLISLDSIMNFDFNGDFLEYNNFLKEKIDLIILKGKEKLEISNNNCNIINDEIKEKKEYINKLNKLQFNKINEVIEDLNNLNQNKEDLKILCNFTKLFIDFQEIVYLLYGKLIFINGQLNSLHIKYKEADNSNVNNPMNTIEELNKKFKEIEEIIKNIQNDGIYKNYEINQKILYKNVLLKINRKEMILQHIIKETKIINELQRKININYEKINERNILFKEIIIKIDSCEDSYKNIVDLFKEFNAYNLYDNNYQNINILYKELKENFDNINKLIEDETKNMNIIDSLIINNKIKYLNNKVDDLKINLNKSKEDLNCHMLLIKQIDLILNLENLFIKIKTNFDINEEKISSIKNQNYYQERKTYQDSMDKSVQTLIQSYEEVNEKFDISSIKELNIKNYIKNYYQNLNNNINKFLENFKNFYSNNNKEDEEAKIYENNNITEAKQFFQELLKNNYLLINDRDNILIKCESLYKSFSKDLNDIEVYIKELKNLYQKHSNMYESLSKNEKYNICNDINLCNSINNIKNEWFSNIEYIKQIYNDLEKRNDIINSKIQYLELKDILLKKLLTSEDLLKKLNPLENQNFKDEIENLLKLVSEEINQWDINTQLLNDANNIFQKIENYYEMNIQFINNENFENFIICNDTNEYNEINNYICINTSKLNNLKDILYNITNLQIKYETLNNDLNESMNIENFEFLQKSLNSTNSFNELRIINNQYNQDFENIKKDSNDIIDSLNKYKYYLSEYNIDSNDIDFNKPTLQYIDDAKRKIDEIIKAIEIFIDIKKINIDLNDVNNLFKLIKKYREKNIKINYLLTESKIINLELKGEYINIDEIKERIDNLNSVLNITKHNITDDNINNNNFGIYNKLFNSINMKYNEDLTELKVIINKNIKKYDTYNKGNDTLNIYDGKSIQNLKNNIHSIMNIYNKLINEILIIDYINVLRDKCDNLDNDIIDIDFFTLNNEILSKNEQIYLDHIENIKKEVKYISNYINSCENLLNNKTKNQKIEDLKYYNEICEILFFIDNSKIKIDEFKDIFNDTLSIYKYHKETLNVHLMENYFLNKLIYAKSNEKCDITSNLFDETKNLIKDIENKHEIIKNILNKSLNWESELYNSIFIINNNVILKIWNDIENNIDIIRNEETNINYISNQANYIINNLENIKNDLNIIFPESLTFLINYSINNNNDDLLNNFNSKYVFCKQQCIKNFDNLINYYFNQNFKVGYLNETINDIHNILLQVNNKFYNQHLIFKYIANKKDYLEKQFYIYSLLEKIDKLIESNSNKDYEVEFNIYQIKKYENEIQQFLAKNINNFSWFIEIKEIDLKNEDEKKERNHCIQYIKSFNEKIYKRNLIINSKINYYMEKNDLTKFKYSVSRNSSIQNIYENIDLKKENVPEN